MSKLYFHTVGQNTSAFAAVTDLVGVNALPILPSYTTGLEQTSRMNSLQFGNGYKQEEPDGINPNPITCQVVFENRSKRLIEELQAFLFGGKTVTGNVQYDRTPADYFYWIPPQPYDQYGAIKVKCYNIKISWKAPNVGTLSATFEQTFEI